MYCDTCGATIGIFVCILMKSDEGLPVVKLNAS